MLAFWLLFLVVLARVIPSSFSEGQDLIRGKEQKQNASNLKLGLVGMIGWWRGPPFQLDILGAALPIAIGEVNAENSSLLQNHNLSFSVADSSCKASTAVAALVTLVQTQQVDAIIGPSCSVSCIALSHLATAWNIPVISFGCGAEELADKALFPTFVRAKPMVSAIMEVHLKLLQINNWRSIALVSSESGYNDLFRDYVSEIYPEQNISIEINIQFPVSQSMEEQSVMFRSILQKVSKVARGKCLYYCSFCL